MINNLEWKRPEINPHIHQISLDCIKYLVGCLGQIKNQVNSLEKLSQYIDITSDEEKAIKTLNMRWGTTPYYVSLMDKNNPDCPI